MIDVFVFSFHDMFETINSGLAKKKDLQKVMSLYHRCMKGQSPIIPPSLYFEIWWEKEKPIICFGWTLHFIAINFRCSGLISEMETELK